MSGASRFSRHFSLQSIGEAGQEQIGSSSALVIGVGGIGCSVAMQLAAAGIGTLILNDFDTVDASNLARQLLFRETDCGRKKVAVAADTLTAAWPLTSVDTLSQRLNADELHASVLQADIVLDCSDNFATRFSVNDACVATKTVLVSGAAIRNEGQLAIFGPDYAAGPCYRCVYADSDESLDDCRGSGVLAPVPGVIGAAMAASALLLLCGNSMPSRLALYDALSLDWRSLAIRKSADCAVCGN